MKLRNKLSLITLVSMLAFAGVGFASWTFTKSINDSASVSGKATAAIEASGLAVKDGAGNDVSALYLICDAPTSAELTDAGVTGLLPGYGIYWSTENSNDHSKAITTLTLVGSVLEHDEDILDFSTYTGHFASTATGAVAGTWVNIAASSALDTTVVSADKDDDVEYVWTLPAPSYADIPESVAEVDALKTEVNNINLTFSFTFNVASVA